MATPVFVTPKNTVFGDMVMINSRAAKPYGRRS